MVHDCILSATPRGRPADPGELQCRWSPLRRLSNLPDFSCRTWGAPGALFAAALLQKLQQRCTHSSPVPFTRTVREAVHPHACPMNRFSIGKAKRSCPLLQATHNAARQPVGVSGACFPCGGIQTSPHGYFRCVHAANGGPTLQDDPHFKCDILSQAWPTRLVPACARSPCL